MSSFIVSAPGIDAVIKIYTDERKRLQKGQRSALLAAARVVRLEAKRQAPSTRGGWTAWRRGERDKPLSTSIGSKVFEDAISGTKVLVRSGSRKAHLVILGTAAHREPKSGSSKGPMPIGGGRFARIVMHPGSQPNHFLTRALALSREEAIAAYKNSLFPGG